MDQDPSSHQPQSHQQQQHQSLQSSLINATPTTTNSNNHGHLYSNGSPPNHNRHSNGHLSTGTITSTTTTNSVGQILGLTGQQFKFATNHLQTHSNGTARKYQCKMCPQVRTYQRIACKKNFYRIGWVQMFNFGIWVNISLSPSNWVHVWDPTLHQIYSKWVIGCYFQFSIPFIDQKNYYLSLNWPIVTKFFSNRNVDWIVW